MKVIQPLFLDKLEAALEDARKSESKLKALLDRISKIKVFDPACGSGNFLIIAYKELRRIEMSVFKALGALKGQSVIPISGMRLSQFYGVEIDDFAHEIALLSLWLTEHQMNQVFKGEFGSAPAALPLNSSGNIYQGNSLRLNWFEVCPRAADEEVYVCGNPPFLGHAGRSDEQNADMELIFKDLPKFGQLDFVCSWLWKGVKYIKNSQSELAFVTTNSVCQGVQVGALWPHVFGQGIEIKFAYQAFPWRNSARDNAGVHVSVIGLTQQKYQYKRLFKLLDKQWHEVATKNISPYLLDAPSIIVQSRTTPMGPVPKMIYGSMPNEGGFLLLTPSERLEILKAEPEAQKWIRKILGAEEFINGKERYCLWLVGAKKSDIAVSAAIANRVESVRILREKSSRKTTTELSAIPHLFGEIRHPESGNYILVPYTTSERRSYVPVGFYSSDTISTNSNNIIPGGGLYEAGVLMSLIHIDWMKTVGGRMESRYRYSAQLVYNTFPWPSPSTSARKQVEDLAEKVLVIRENFPDKTLAQLYDPELMPQALLVAHQALDVAVEKLYRDKPFKDSSERLEHLFKLYEKLNPSSRMAESNDELW
jgi:hypothetical protein